ncbi:coproporphyrinogen III oxidase [Boletus coccyginus]|nr:coproporphyrinogen III oxidase [Boletus coccyginus]
MATSTPSPASSAPKPMRERMADYITRLQETIVTKLETYGSGQRFRRESWTRDEGGGGLSYTFPPLDTSPIGNHPIEKGGVNISTINGILPPAAVKQMSTAHAALKDIDKSLPFFAAGISIILHPRHPRVPTAHANCRYFEVLDVPLPYPCPRDPTTPTPPAVNDNDNGTNTDSDDPIPEPTVLAWWFGATTNLTPAYVNEPDFGHFHSTLKTACDTWTDAAHTAISVYPPFKSSCDDYLYIPHRHEHRGIGGIRFDDMDSDAMRTLLRRVAVVVPLTEDTFARLSTQEALFDLVTSLGDSFPPSFIPILERRMGEPVVPSERRWQLLRRGRAVEFSLVIDRNVLVGMPPEARWEYCSELGTEDRETEEAEMVKILKKPRSWVD